MIEEKQKSEDKKIIHLYITDRCSNNCKFCCNKQEQWNPHNIPAVTVEELRNAHTVLLTGGEPFLLGIMLPAFVRELRTQYTNVENLYVYTSGWELHRYFRGVIAARGSLLGSLRGIDGLNISPKTKSDWLAFNDLMESEGTSRTIGMLKSNRLYIMDGDNKLAPSVELPNFEVIDRPWQEDFKPNGGIFRRLPILF